MEIKIGEYIRSNKGQIDRLQYEIDNNWRSKDNNGNIIARCEKNKYCLENIIKHSKNIIDLIEVGDVLKIKEDNSIVYLGLTKPETTIVLEDIIEAIQKGKIELLEILTHEQFNQNSYKVEE